MMETNSIISPHSSRLTRYLIHWRGIIVTVREKWRALLIATISGLALAVLSLVLWPPQQEAETLLAPGDMAELPSGQSTVSYIPVAKQALPADLAHMLELFNSARLATTIFRDRDLMELFFGQDWFFQHDSGIWLRRPPETTWQWLLAVVRNIRRQVLTPIGWPNADALSPDAVRTYLADNMHIDTTSQLLVRIRLKGSSGAKAVTELSDLLALAGGIYNDNKIILLEKEVKYIEETLGKHQNQDLSERLIAQLRSDRFNIAQLKSPIKNNIVVIIQPQINTAIGYGIERRLFMGYLISFSFLIFIILNSKFSFTTYLEYLFKKFFAPQWLARSTLIVVLTTGLIIPKAGIKIGDIPITWGYLTYGILCTILSLFFVSRSVFRREHLIPILSSFAFCFIATLALYYYGTDDSSGFIISFYVSFGFLPITMLAILGTLLSTKDLLPISQFIRTAVFLICLYGLAAHLYFALTGSVFVIPGITANIDDTDIWSKDNGGRFGFLKLTSTYNNGNLLGICLLMMSPLFLYLESSRIKRILLHLTLVLTLSRTVWIGLLLLDIYWVLTRSRQTIRGLLQLLGIAGLVTVVVFMAIQTNLFQLSFLLDSSLGGRAGQLSALDHICWLPCQRSTFLIQEIIYLSIIDNFGIIGFSIAIILFTAPLILATKRGYLADPIKKKIAEGLVLYLIIAGADGGYLYIPVAYIYWGLTALLLLRPGKVEIGHLE